MLGLPKCRYYNLIVAPHLSEQGMLYVVDLHLMKQENPITGKVHQAWRRNANGESVAAPAGMISVIGTSVLVHWVYAR